MKCKYCDNEIPRGYRVCSCCKPYVRWTRTLDHAGILGKTETLKGDLENLVQLVRTEYEQNGKDPRTIGKQYHIDGMRVRELLKLSGSLRTRSESAKISERIKSRSKNIQYLTKTRWIQYCSEQLGVPEFEVIETLQKFMGTHSYKELWERYRISGQAVSKLGIKTRSRAEATVQLYLSGNVKQGCKRFKVGYHTTWEGNQVYYRSSYEKEYMELLDSLKVPYQVESLNIVYFDSQRNRERIAIPDFFLPQTNEIVEVKSTFTYDEQNMRDKVKAYRAHRYGFRLILDHKEVPIDQLEESIV